MTGELSSTTVVITMAGEGSRFRLAGYTIPKYEIEVHGRTLFAWSMESLRGFIEAGAKFVFVARSHPNIADFLKRECAATGIRKFTILTVDTLTDGQATTAMLARPAVDNAASPLAIYNIDTYVEPRGMDPRYIRGTGWVPCFPGEGDKWSFAAADGDGRVSELREKRRISPHATVGLYWFDSFSRYEAAYNAYYSRAENLEAKERYIAPLYNHLIAEHAEVYLHLIRAEDVYPLGTPEDVQLFRQMPIQSHTLAAV